MKKVQQGNYKGFTLIELMVVIAAIGVLAAVIMLSLNSARAKGRDARRIRDIQEIHNAIELYISDRGYVPDLGNSSCLTPGIGSGCSTTDDSSGWTTLEGQLSPYIKSLAKDPCGASCSGGAIHYMYIAPGSIQVAPGLSSSSYKIFATGLESKSGSLFGFGLEFNSW